MLKYYHQGTITVFIGTLIKTMLVRICAYYLMLVAERQQFNNQVCLITQVYGIMIPTGCLISNELSYLDWLVPSKLQAWVEHTVRLHPLRTLEPLETNTFTCVYRM